jgi:hypothetical protein
MSTVGGGVNIVTNGLVLYLDASNTKSYVSGSTTWDDVSRSRNNGTLINGPTFNSSNGGSIVFDGSNQYAITTNNINISSNNSRSIDVWFQVSNSTSRHVLCSWGSFGGNLLCNLEVNQVIGANTNYPYFAGFNNDAYAAQTIPTNTWTNIVLTYNGGTLNSSNGINLYVNGILKTSLFPSAVSALNTTNSKVYLGYEGAGSRNPMNGRISHCKIYNISLSASEVSQNYNAIKSRFGL